MKRGHTRTAFTIVELLVVIVVIGILTAITIVTYNGVQDSARAATVQDAIKRTNDAIRLYASDPTNGGLYPATLGDVGVGDDEDISYQYTVDNTVSPKTYALTASYGLGSRIRYYGSSASAYIKEGVAPGQNWLVWNEDDNSTVPVEIGGSTTIDTSEFMDGSASIKIASTGVDPKFLRERPIPGVAGQVMKVTMWIKTTADWNGTSGNSKIRISAYPTGTLRGACGYAGPYLSWTKITCSYTLISTEQTQVTIGSDASVGTIWVDGLVLTVI